MWFDLPHHDPEALEESDDLPQVVTPECFYWGFSPKFAWISAEGRISLRLTR